MNVVLIHYPSSILDLLGLKMWKTEKVANPFGPCYYKPQGVEVAKELQRIFGRGSQRTTDEPYIKGEKGVWNLKLVTEVTTTHRAEYRISGKRFPKPDEGTFNKLEHLEVVIFGDENVSMFKLAFAGSLA